VTAAYSSAVFAAWFTLADAMQSAVAWTSHPTTGEDPQIVVGDVVAEPANESIYLVRREEDGAAERTIMTGGIVGQDEEFDLRLVFATSVPGETGREALERIAELVATFEAHVRTDDTGRPQNLDFSAYTAAQCREYFVTTVNPQVFPSGIEGWAGYCEVVVNFVFRI